MCLFPHAFFLSKCLSLLWQHLLTPVVCGSRSPHRNLWGIFLYPRCCLSQEREILQDGTYAADPCFAVNFFSPEQLLGRALHCLFCYLGFRVHWTYSLASSFGQDKSFNVQRWNTFAEIFLFTFRGGSRNRWWGDAVTDLESSAPKARSSGGVVWGGGISPPHRGWVWGGG